MPKKVKPKKRTTWLGELGNLVFSLVICQATGALGAIATMPSIPTWYAGLAKPSFNPPNWIFGPVWTTLYLMMGISLYLVLRRGLRRNGVSVAVFALQLALNSSWSVVFFGLHRPDWAFAVILALFAAIVWTILRFARTSMWAGLLLVPYAGWVSFATVLNLAIWRLNP